MSLKLSYSLISTKDTHSFECGVYRNLPYYFLTFKINFKLMVEFFDEVSGKSKYILYFTFMLEFIDIDIEPIH